MKNRDSRSCAKSVGSSLKLESLESRVLLSTDLAPGIELLGYVDPGELSLMSNSGAEIDSGGDLIIKGSTSVYSSDYGEFTVKGDAPGSYESYVAQIDLDKIECDWINFDGRNGRLAIEDDDSVSLGGAKMFDSSGNLVWSFDTSNSLTDDSEYDSATHTGTRKKIEHSSYIDMSMGKPYAFGDTVKYSDLTIKVKENDQYGSYYSWESDSGSELIATTPGGVILDIAPLQEGGTGGTVHSSSISGVYWISDTLGVYQNGNAYQEVIRHNVIFEIDPDDDSLEVDTDFEFYLDKYETESAEHIVISGDTATLFLNASGVYYTSASSIDKQSDGSWNYYEDKNGYIYGTSSVNGDLELTKYNANGFKHWTTTYGGSGDEYEYPFQVGIDSSDNVYVMGRTTSTDLEMLNASYTETSPYEMYFLASFDGSGSLKSSTYLPTIEADHSGWSATMYPDFMAVEPDGDAIIGYTSSYVKKTRIVKVESTSAPVGYLADDYDDKGYAITDELNEKGYLDLVLSGADNKTVGGDELVLGGVGAEGVSVSGKPKLIDASSCTYRYTLSGDFTDGPVSVTIPTGSFENEKGAGNAQTVANFDSFPDLKLLDINIEPTEFIWNSSDNHFEYSGTVSIGPDVSLTGEVFVPELTVAGSLNIDAEKISAEGLVTTSVAGGSQGVMNGSFEILIDKDTTYFVQDTDAAVSSEITVAGQELRYRAMKIGVSDGQAKLDLQGDIKMPGEFGTNAITLSGNQYLSLTAAGQSLNGATMTFDDVEIDLPYLDLTAEQLSVEYVAAAGVQPEALRFRGKVVLPEVFNATADFTTDTIAGTDGYIEVSADGVKWFGKLSVEEIVIVEDQWEIKQASLEVRDVPGVGMSVQGDGTFTVPPGMDIICGLGFVNEELNYVRLGVDDLDLPIGATGAFLQSINGYVNNIADVDATNIQFGGGLGFTAGKKIEISLPDWAGGDMEGALAEFAVDGGFTFQQLTGTGTVKVAGGLIDGTANATLNWEKGTLKSACTATALNNLLTINGTMSADSNMNVSMIGTGSVSIPSIIPIWGGQSVGNGTTVFKYTNDDTYANDYAAGWGTTSITAFGKVYDFTIGIKVNLDGSYSFLGGKEAAQAQAGASSYSAAKAFGSRSVNIASSVYTAEEDAGWLLINANWDSGNDAEIVLTSPDGTVYDQAAIDSSDNITIVDALSADGSKVILIDSPDAGDWTLTVQSDEDLGNVDFNGYEPSDGVEVAIDSVAVDPYIGEVEIEYSGGSQVSFYYDVDNSGDDGILIGSELADGSYSWDTSSVAAGTYYVYAMTEGEGDVPYVSYFANPVTIEESLPEVDVAVGTGGASKVVYTDSDGTVVTVSVKSASAVLSFIGENIVTEGSKTLVVTGDNLILKEIVIPDSTSSSSLTISAKGGSDGTALIGDMYTGSLKSISGKGVELIGDIGVAGSLSSLQWGDIADSCEIIVAEAGNGCSVKVGNVGDDVEISIMDIVKSVSAQSFASGELNSVELGKFSVKEGDVGVDILTTVGGIGGVAVAGDLSGEILSSGYVKSISSKSGTISSYIISYDTVSKVSAYDFDQATIYGTSVGSVSCKGDMHQTAIVVTDGDLGAVKVTGDMELIASVNGTIKALSAKGDISGRIDARKFIGKVSANNMIGAKVSSLENVGTISLKGDMLDSWVLSGYSMGDDARPGSDDLFGSGDIKGVSVKGVFGNSIISAGKLPDISAFADIDDIDLPYELNGSIGSVKFGSVDYDADSIFGVFAADEIKSVKDGKMNAETNGNFMVG